VLKRRWRRLTTKDRIRKGDEVLHHRKWIPATDTDGRCWDRQIYPDSPKLRRPIVSCADEKAELEKKRMPIEFHVKSSEWAAMPDKTKAALIEMVKCAAKQFGKNSRLRARHHTGF